MVFEKLASQFPFQCGNLNHEQVDPKYSRASGTSFSPLVPCNHLLRQHESTFDNQVSNALSISLAPVLIHLMNCDECHR